MMLERVDGTIDSVTEVYQFVSFNLKASLEQLERLEDGQPGEPHIERSRELAVGAIERAVARLSAEKERIRTLDEDVYSQIISHVDDRLRDLESLILLILIMYLPSERLF